MISENDGLVTKLDFGTNITESKSKIELIRFGYLKEGNVC